MSKRIWLLPLCCLCGLLFTACTQASNPLVQAEATPLPGISQTLPAASASESNSSEMEVTLYYRYLDYPFLAAQSRTLSVKRDESPEYAVIQALLEGPSAERIELRRLFGEDVSLRSLRASDDVLFVTLSDALLRDDIPTDWQSQEDWATEAPIQRRLTAQSLVNTITENFSYASVQLMVAREDGSSADTRLQQSYFLSGGAGPTDPLRRDESLILTAHNTASLIMTAWQERDFETLYAFTATASSQSERPIYESFLTQMDQAPALTEFSVSQGSVSENGGFATLTLSFRLQRDNADSQWEGYPLRLVRENAVWKAPYSALRQMMLR